MRPYLSSGGAAHTRACLDRGRPAAGTGNPVGTGVGIVIRIPEPAASELGAVRAGFARTGFIGTAALVPPHITLVTTTTTHDWDAMTAHVRAVAGGREPFEIKLNGTGTFRPLSPVVYLNVEAGFEECVALHRRLQAGPLQRQHEFSFHPHVTVAQDLPDAQLDEAARALDLYRTGFRVSSIGLYEHGTDGVWILREELSLGAEETPQAAPGAVER